MEKLLVCLSEKPRFAKNPVLVGIRYFSQVGRKAGAHLFTSGIVLLIKQVTTGEGGFCVAYWFLVRHH